MFWHRRCTHPVRCRDTIFNGTYWVTLCGLCGEIFSMKPDERNNMSFSLSSLPSKAEVEADLAKVADVLAVVEKYEAALPLPATVKTGIADLQKALTFAQDVLNEL
jgi:hypothetical protein